MSTEGAPSEAVSDRRWWTLLAVCGATLMLLVDVTIVQVALPTIQRHLHSSFTDLQWVIDAYALSLATLLLTWGTVADRIGRKRVFLVGIVVFTTASLICGLANSSTMLIWARAAQGCGGAALFATGLALIGQEFRGVERGKALAAWGATVGVAVAIGPLAGGGLTDAFGWRWIFFVNVPIGLVTVIVAVTKMTNIGDPEAKRLDLLGLVTFAASLFLLIIGLLRGNDDGWTSATILACIVGAGALLALFVVIELRLERPMFDLSLFRSAGFTGVSIAVFLLGAGMFALYPYLTFYLQNGLGYSPLAGGLRLLPSTLLCFIVPLVTRSTTERLPPGIVLGAGLGITGLGIALMTGLSASSSWTALLAGLILTGFGIGVANPAIAKIALGVVPRRRSGMASGISNTFRIAGLATGIAALGAVFQDQLSSSLRAHLPGLPSGETTAIATSGLHAAQGFRATQPNVVSATHIAYAATTDDLAVIGATVVFVGAVIATGLIRGRHLRHAEAESTPREATLAAADVS